MPASIWPILAAIATLGSFQSTASADLIFDNTANATSGITTTPFQIGAEVTAASGASLSVTELDLGFTSQGVSATANLQAFLYANDGSGGAPGTLLWQSPVMTGVSINSTNALIAFTVPSVVVPDTFTFTGVVTNDSPVVGFVPANGATVGTFENVWVDDTGSWTSLPSDFEIEARVIGSSVPEPSAIVLLGIGMALLTRFRRFAAARPA